MRLRIFTQLEAYLFEIENHPLSLCLCVCGKYIYRSTPCILIQTLSLISLCHTLRHSKRSSSWPSSSWSRCLRNCFPYLFSSRSITFRLSWWGHPQCETNIERIYATHDWAICCVINQSDKSVIMIFVCVNTQTHSHSWFTHRHRHPAITPSHTQVRPSYMGNRSNKRERETRRDDHRSFRKGPYRCSKSIYICFPFITRRKRVYRVFVYSLYLR